jgi:hypothetical protein
MFWPPTPASAIAGDMHAHTPLRRVHRLANSILAAAAPRCDWLRHGMRISPLTGALSR